MVTFRLIDYIVPRGGVVRFGTPPAPECYCFVPGVAYSSLEEAVAAKLTFGEVLIVRIEGPSMQILEV